MKRLLIIATIALTILIADAAYSKQEPLSQDDVIQLDTIQQLEQKIYVMDKKILELEEQIKTLKQSHEMAILVNQDLDERVSKVEEKRRN